ncbi:MAG: hypothetical protein JXR96_07085 [Deltaproteobacteria bacterium]|nr:hypothetical protein [Deltaproteobacteria bacterium]
MKSFLKIVAVLASLSLLLAVVGCETLGGKKIGAGALDTSVPAKYENFFNKCKQYETDIKETKQYIEETPKVLAGKVGLEPGASWEEVKTAVTSRLQDTVFKVGGKIEISVEGGLDASAGAGGASASAQVVVTIRVTGMVEPPEGIQELLDAGKTTMERLIGSAKKLKSLAERAPKLVKEAKDLAASAKNDIKNPATAAEVAAKLSGIADMLGGVPDLADKTIKLNVEVSASFSGGASAEGSAEVG